MIHNHAISIPFEQIMQKYYPEFGKHDFIDVISQFYSDSNSCLQSMPFNSSTGVLYYNKTLIQKAGINENELQTYAQFEKALIKANNIGVLGYTTAWPAAYHIEHLCCLHNLPFAENENGFLNPKAKLCYLNPMIIQHFNNLHKWQKEGLFSYQGRFTEKPEALFVQGKCAFLMQGANRFALLLRVMKDEIGTTFLPYYHTATDKRYNLNIGGASFWTLKGFNKKIYQGIAQFFNFLSRPYIQARWHQSTGYLPISKTAYALTMASGFYEKNKAHKIAVESVINGDSPVFPHTKGVRLENYTSIRNDIIDKLEDWINQ